MNLRLSLPRSSRRTFRYDTISQILFAGLMGLAPMAAVVARKALSASDVEVALIHSAMFLGFLMSFLTAGPSQGRRKMAFAFWPRVMGHAILLLVAFATSSWFFTIVFLVAHATMQLSLPAVTGIYSLNYPDDARGRILGFIRMVQGPLLIGFTLMGGILMNRDGSLYRLFFPLAGFLGMLGALAFTRIRIKETKETPSGPPPTLLQSISPGQVVRVFRENRVFALFMGTWFFFGFANIMCRPAAAMYFVDPQYGVNADYIELSLLTTIIPQSMLIGTIYFWGRVFDRTNVITLRGILQIFWSVELLLYFLTNRIEILYGGVALRGFAAAGTNLIWTIGIIRFAPPREVPLYMGIHTGLTGLRGIIAPHVGIALKAFLGLHAVFLLGFIVMVITSVVILFLPKELPSKGEEDQAADPEDPNRLDGKEG